MKKLILLIAILNLVSGCASIKEMITKSKASKKPSEAVEKKEEAPLLTQPKVKRVWVKDKVQGKRFIKGHWEYIIKEQSVWNH